MPFALLVGIGFARIVKGIGPKVGAATGLSLVVVLLTAVMSIVAAMRRMAQ